MGGICVISPVMAAAPSARSSSVMCSQGKVSSGSVAASCEGVDSPRRIVPV